MLFKEIKKELITIEKDIEEYEKKLEELKNRKNELLKLKEEKKEKLKKKRERENQNKKLIKTEASEQSSDTYLSKRKYVSDKELDIILGKKTIKDAASIIKDFLKITPKQYFFRYASLQNTHGWSMQEMVILKVPFSEKDQAKKLGCRWIKDIKKWATEENNNFEKIVKRWGYNNKNIAYKFEIEDDDHKQVLYKNKEVKKLIDSGDIKAKIDGVYCYKLYMLEMNKNIKKFKDIYKELINQ